MLCFPIPLLTWWSLLTQGSRDLFELNLVWNVQTSMHPLMIKVIPFYGGSTHLDNFTSGCKEMETGVCALSIINEKRRRREDCLSKRTYSYTCALSLPLPAPGQHFGDYFQGDLPLPVGPEIFLVTRLLCIICLGKHEAKHRETRD